MNLPPITHLQFLILSQALTDELSGREMRERLAAHGVRRTLAAFYQLMSRLEESGLIEGRYVAKAIKGQSVRERRYAVTTAGQEAYEATCRFYRVQVDTRSQEARG